MILEGSTGGTHARFGLGFLALKASSLYLYCYLLENAMTCIVNHPNHHIACLYFQYFSNLRRNRNYTEGFLKSVRSIGLHKLSTPIFRISVLYRNYIRLLQEILSKSISVNLKWVKKAQFKKLPSVKLFTDMFENTALKRNGTIFYLIVQGMT